MTVAETLECKTIPQFIFVPVGEDLPPDIRERWLVSSAIIGVVWVIIGIWLTNDLKPWLVKGRQIYHWTPRSRASVRMHGPSQGFCTSFKSGGHLGRQ